MPGIFLCGLFRNPKLYLTIPNFPQIFFLKLRLHVKGQLISEWFKPSFVFETKKWNCLSTFHFLIAYSIHKSVLNLPYDLSNENADAKEDLQQLEYGNKIAILGKNFFGLSRLNEQTSKKENKLPTCSLISFKIYLGSI